MRSKKQSRLEPALSDISGTAIGARATLETTKPERTGVGRRFRLPATCQGLPLLGAAIDRRLASGCALAGGEFHHFTAHPMAGETPQTFFAGLLVALP
jgi:hypothetical protein